MKTKRRALPPDEIRIAGDTLLSMSRVSSALSISLSRAYRLVREGSLAVEYPKQFPRTPYVRASALRAYHERRTAWLQLHQRPVPALAI